MENTRLERPIVVGVKDKQLSALRYAMTEASRQKCGVRVVHAYALSDLEPSLLMTEALELSAEGILGTAKAFLDSEGCEVPVEYVAEVGSASRVLSAQSESARALVLGPDNTSWYEHILTGEVGSWLATHAKSPVVIVPEGWDETHGRRGGLVVSVDGATDAHGPLTFAFAAAERRGEELHVIHVVPPATSQGDEDEHRLNIAEVLSGWAEQYPDVTVFRSLVLGRIDEACAGATSLANLVVVGRPQGRLLPFSLSKPVASAVIKEANCPVAVIPANYDGYSADG